jgi:hypothetical protein
MIKSETTPSSLGTGSVLTPHDASRVTRPVYPEGRVHFEPPRNHTQQAACPASASASRAVGECAAAQLRGLVAQLRAHRHDGWLRAEPGQAK